MKSLIKKLYNKIKAKEIIKDVEKLLENSYDYLEIVVTGGGSEYYIVIKCDRKKERYQLEIVEKELNETKILVTHFHFNKNAMLNKLHNYIREFIGRDYLVFIC